MSPDWAAEETRLWNDMMYARPRVESARRNAKILAGAKRRGQDLGRVRKRWGMVTEEQAVAASWKAYRAWMEH